MNYFLDIEISKDDIRNEVNERRNSQARRMTIKVDDFNKDNESNLEWTELLYRWTTLERQAY